MHRDVVGHDTPYSAVGIPLASATPLATTLTAAPKDSDVARTTISDVLPRRLLNTMLLMVVSSRSQRGDASPPTDRTLVRQCL